MCFLMDPQFGKKLCYVQFPQRFDGIDRHDRYANRNIVFFDVRSILSFVFLIYYFLEYCTKWLLFRSPFFLNNLFFFWMQINMRGLDGVQGPVYVGTGCVFNRQALYGYDPPASEKRPKMSCDCWPTWCCCCCFGKRKKTKSNNVA